MMPLREQIKFVLMCFTLPFAFLAELGRHGWRATWAKTVRFLFRTPRYRYQERFEEPAMREEIARFSSRPLFSVILPVYNTPADWLSRAVESVRSQIYDNWELCIADDASTRPETRAVLDALADPRIRVQRLAENRGISGASNAALSMARGDYVALLDHDDELTRDALFENARAIQLCNPDVVYSDEDMMLENGRCLNPHFKPDFAPDLLLSHNYITHLLILRRSLVQQAGGFRTECDGAQDYDLVLRATETARRIAHVRRVLYHWRCHRASTSLRTASKPYTVEAGRRAVEGALERRGELGRVDDANLPNYFRVRREISGEPMVSILIPFRDQPRLLEKCVESIIEKSTYHAFEIIGIDNQSADPRTQEAKAKLSGRDSRVRFESYPDPFNYSRINNFAVSRSRGEHVLLLNNDIEILSPGWLEALLEHSQREGIGAVGGKLYYPNHTVQHAGVVVGISGFAGHSFRRLPRRAPGFFNRACVIHNVAAVTGAMLMVKRRLYEEVGGLNEEGLGTALNDVDFCLRLLETGQANVFTPYAEAFHHESVSRGYETTPEKMNRFEKEVACFKERHARVLREGDPFYNPNLTMVYEDYRYGGGPFPGSGLLGVYDAAPQQPASWRSLSPAEDQVRLR